jgi:hypothetical protein
MKKMKCPPLILVGYLSMAVGCASSRETAVDPPPVAPCSVLIEVKFVELSEEDLDKLGLEWIVSDDWEPNDQKTESQRETQP